MDTEIISVVSALAGVLLGGVLTRNGEYRRWLRAEQHKAATELLAAGESIRRSFADRTFANLRREISVIRGREESAEAPDLDLMRHNAFAETQERMALALEAFRTVFPTHAAELATAYGDAARKIGRLRPDDTEVPTPGEQYHAAREALTAEVRRLVAPSSYRNRFVNRRQVSRGEILPIPNSATLRSPSEESAP